MQSREARTYIFQIDFKMLNIHGIEADDCCEQTNVCFCEASTEEVGPRAGYLAYVGFCSRKRGENVKCSALVNVL